MLDVIFDLEQNVLREKFFTDPEAFFEESEANPSYFIYREICEICRKEDVENLIEIEDIGTMYFVYSEDVKLLIVNGLGKGYKNCANRLYFFYNPNTKKAKYYFSANKIDIADVYKSKKPGLYAWDNQTKFMVYKSDHERDEDVQFNFEIRAFICDFLEVDNVVLPRLYKLSVFRKHIPPYVEIINCGGDDCDNTFAYDMRGVEEGDFVMGLCPHCYSFFTEVYQTPAKES